MKSLVFLFVSLSVAFAFAEEAPEPEYPYPKSYKRKKNARPLDIEAPARVGPDGAYYYKDTPKMNTRPRSYRGVEAPSRMGSDGSYYYENKPQKKTQNKDYRVNSDGSIEYFDDTKRKVYSHEGIEDPKSANKDGSYTYRSRNQKYSKVFYFRAGVMGPYDLKGANDNPQGYREIYSEDAEFVVNFEYEWKLFESLGAFNFKVGSGFQLVPGEGRFLSPANRDLKPKESFQFILIPNLGLFTYKFDSGGEQWFVPYLEAGGGYFAVWEKRSDDQKNRFGGAAVLAASVGVLISMDAMGLGVDPDEGYSRSWMDIQLRQIIGVDSRKDFTATGITFGLGLGF